MLYKGFTESEKDMARDLLYKMLDNIVDYRNSQEK